MESGLEILSKNSSLPNASFGVRAVSAPAGRVKAAQTKTAITTRTSDKDLLVFILSFLSLIPLFFIELSLLDELL
jgi:hypothetical protein